MALATPKASYRKATRLRVDATDTRDEESSDTLLLSGFSRLIRHNPDAQEAVRYKDPASGAIGLRGKAGTG